VSGLWECWAGHIGQEGEQGMSEKDCVTHHHGCDCREGRIGLLIREVMESHGGEHCSCDWCKRAKEIGFSVSLGKGDGWGQVEDKALGMVVAMDKGKEVVAKGKGKEEGYVKYSREHGQMYLTSYASGDGSISFRWVLESDKRRVIALREVVSESDVSEYLRIHGNEEKWVGWDTLDIGNIYPHIVLVRDVSRPPQTSKQLVLDGVVYRYAAKSDVSTTLGTYNGNTTSFFEVQSGKVVEDSEVIAMLCFFLNHELAFINRTA
jgi:hypothetical protein